MDIRTSYQKGSMTIWPEKLRTQQEVDISNYTKEKLIAELEELSTTEIVT